MTAPRLACVAGAALAATVGVACGPDLPDAVPTVDWTPLPACDVQPEMLGLDTVARGLEVPWAIAVTPDDRVLITERSGRLRQVVDGRLVAEPLLTVPALDAPGEESGLMGVALAPDFAETGNVLLLVTVRSPGTSGLVSRIWGRLARWVDPFGALPYENRIVQVQLSDTAAGPIDVLVDGLPANRIHAGGALAFGPDGLLYAGVGDARYPPAAGDSASPVATILRYAPDGSVPADNPLPGSPVFAWGLRNVQGLAWLPDGTLFATDHGPTALPDEAGRFGLDELNRIVAGRGYGWPAAAGPAADPRFADPVHTWRSAFAPAGLARRDGALYVTGLRGRRLARFGLRQGVDGWSVECQGDLLSDRFGRLRALAVGADGALYLGTSNRDGRGDPRPHDDLLVRLRLGPEPGSMLR